MRHGLAHLLAALARRVAEGGIADRKATRGVQPSLRTVAAASMAISARSSAVGQFGDDGVGDEQGAALGQHDRHADHPAVGVEVDDAQDLFQHLVEGAGRRR